MRKPCVLEDDAASSGGPTTTRTDAVDARSFRIEINPPVRERPRLRAFWSNCEAADKVGAGACLVRGDDAFRKVVVPREFRPLVRREHRVDPRDCRLGRIEKRCDAVRTRAAVHRIAGASMWQGGDVERTKQHKADDRPDEAAEADRSRPVKTQTGQSGSPGLCVGHCARAKGRRSSPRGRRKSAAVD